MSHSDYPPGYDESRGPLYGGNSPQPPAYGFPGYGGLHPGQPSAPYLTDPNTPLYPGQPGGYPGGGYPGGGYPGGPYPGQPYPGGPPGAGYPSPPPIPPVIPPTIPSDVLSSGESHVSSSFLMSRLSDSRHPWFYLTAPTQVTDLQQEEAAGTASAFGMPSSERWSRLDRPQSCSFHLISSLKGQTLTLAMLARVFQVYLVLASQLIVTTAIVSVFTFVWVCRVCFAGLVLCVCVLHCWSRLCGTENLLETLWGNIKPSTGCHSAYSLVLLLSSFPVYALTLICCIIPVPSISSPTLCWCAAQAPGENHCSALKTVSYSEIFNLLSLFLTAGGNTHGTSFCCCCL